MCECEQVEVVIYRYPEGSGSDGLEVDVFCGGEPIPDAVTTVVDPGAGYSAEDWAENAEDAMKGTSPAAAKKIAQQYAWGAETKYITRD